MNHHKGPHNNSVRRAALSSRMTWRAKEHCLCSGASLLFLGEPSSSPPSSPSHPRKLPPGCRTQESVLVVSQQVMVRTQGDTDAPQLWYFEIFVKTPGGGAQPSGTVGIGLAESDDGQEAQIRRFLHYHSSKGSKLETFPRPASKALRPCYPPFSSGLTSSPAISSFQSSKRAHVLMAFLHTCLPYARWQATRLGAAGQQPAWCSSRSTDAILALRGRKCSAPSILR